MFSNLQYGMCKCDKTVKYSSDQLSLLYLILCHYNSKSCDIFTCNGLYRTYESSSLQQGSPSPFSHTRLAFLEVVDRGLAESVLKPSIGVGTFKKNLFLFDPSLTSGMSAALMQGHCLRRRPCIKQHVSGGREFHRTYHRQLPPHLTRHETLHAAGLD